MDTRLASDPNVALYAVMLRNFPWVDGVAILILLAGLQAIPYEIVESAMMDGAGEMRRFWSIELPLIAGQIKLISVLTIMWGVQEFTAVFAMTQVGRSTARWCRGCGCSGTRSASTRWAMRRRLGL